jgi:hypothetical protein
MLAHPSKMVRKVFGAFVSAYCWIAMLDCLYFVQSVNELAAIDTGGNILDSL